MALCRKCRVREASDIWYDGLCSYCYYEREKNRKKEEQRDREQRESQDRERRYREERDREEKERRREQEREERRHREHLEELREEEVEYQRQAARDAEIAREEAEETRRIAGLKTFTCVRCEANFNEEHGVSAIKSPIGKPLCEDCLSLYAKCDFCNKIFWADKIPIKTFEHVYVDGNPIQKKNIIKKICFGCQNTTGRKFIVEQQKLEEKYEHQ